MEDEKITAAAEKIYKYHQMEDELSAEDSSQYDGILCMCSSDLRVAHHAAEMWKKKEEGWLLFSGGYGTGPHSGANLLGWTKPEAEIFADEAVKSGVPREVILVECEAKNSGENISKSRELLLSNQKECKRMLVVQKPFMLRRTFATFKKVWPEPEIMMSSMKLSWAKYSTTSEVPQETIANIMVGDLQRVKLYGDAPFNFQIHQQIPQDVWEAYEYLVGKGFTWNLIKEQ
eukprot:m.145966 g.145966  ORF g.145966 m.145966 type:complete len:231 (+) comp14959_c0_seq6:220-912(+)